MKRTLTIAVAILTVLMLLCTGAFAKGNGGSGNGSQQQGGMQTQTQAQTSTQQQSGTQTQTGNQQQGGNQTQSGDMQPGQNGQGPASEAPGSQYGRFVDTQQLAATIAALADDDARANLTTMLQLYQDAVQSQDREAIQERLRAMIALMTQEQLRVSERDRERLMIFTQGSYLDTEAVTEAIASVTDESTAATLTDLLAAYAAALETKDPQVIHDAFIALTTALSEAGITM